MEKPKSRLPKSSGPAMRPKKVAPVYKSRCFLSEEGYSKREKERGFQSGFLQRLFDGAEEEMKAAEQILGITKRDSHRVGDESAVKSSTTTGFPTLDLGGICTAKMRNEKSSPVSVTRFAGSRFVDSLIEKNKNEKIITDRLDAVLLDLEDEESKQRCESSELGIKPIQSIESGGDDDVLLELVNEFKRLSNGINISDRCYVDVTKQYVPFLFIEEKESKKPTFSNHSPKYKDLCQRLFSTPELALSNLVDYSLLIYISKLRPCPAFVIEWLLYQICTQSCLLSLEAAFHTLSRLLPAATQNSSEDSSEGIADHLNPKTEVSRRPKRKCQTRRNFEMNLYYIKVCFEHFRTCSKDLENIYSMNNQMVNEPTKRRSHFFKADNSSVATFLFENINQSESDLNDERLPPEITKEKQSVLKVELLQYRVQLFFDLVSACLKTNAFDLSFDEYFVVIPLFYRVLVDPTCQGILASVQSSISSILTKFLAQRPPHNRKPTEYEKIKFEMCQAIIRSVPNSNQNNHAVYWQLVLLTPCFNKTHGLFRGLLAYAALHELINLYTGCFPPIALVDREADTCYNIDHVTAELGRLEVEKIERWGTICIIVLLSEIAISIFDRETLHLQKNSLSRWIQIVCSIDRYGREIKNASLELTRAKDLIVGATVKMKILLNQLNLDCKKESSISTED